MIRLTNLIVYSRVPGSLGTRRPGAHAHPAAPEARAAVETSARGSRRPSHLWALAAIGAFVAVYASWQLFRWGPAGSRGFFADAFFYPIEIAAVVTAWRASQRCAGMHRLQTALAPALARIARVLRRRRHLEAATSWRAPVRTRRSLTPSISRSTR